MPVRVEAFRAFDRASAVSQEHPDLTHSFARLGPPLESELPGASALQLTGTQLRHERSARESRPAIESRRVGTAEDLFRVPEPAAPAVQRKRGDLADFQQKASKITAKDQLPDKSVTVKVGASHTGDMYHVQAARGLYPALKVLLWDIVETDGDDSLKTGLDMAAYFGGTDVVYYVVDRPNWVKRNDSIAEVMEGLTSGEFTGRALTNEGGATTIILKGIQGSSDQGTSLGSIKEAVAPIGEKGDAFKRDLDKAEFRKGTSYVLVNFRSSGHTREGGTHPELDTGEEGWEQLDYAVSRMGHRSVPMGEYNPWDATPNLVEYYTWDSCKGDRGAQAGLLRYLNENYTVTGAIGMRSGVMDMLAFAGIPIISIDISPYTREGPKKTPGGKSGGWERGLKLEEALGSTYGRAFIHDERTDESTRDLEHWAGEFSEPDIEAITSALGNYFENAWHWIKSTPGKERHSSHPLNEATLDTMLKRLEARLRQRNTTLTKDQTKVLEDVQRHLEKEYVGLEEGVVTDFKRRINTLLS